MYKKYIYVYIYTHTHTHIYTHTYTHHRFSHEIGFIWAGAMPLCFTGVPRS